MNKRVIIGIIVLMSVALFGLIALQIYWINNILELKEQEFSQHVHEAMLQATRKHDRHVKKELLANTFQLFDGKQVIISGKDTIQIDMDDMAPAASNFLEEDLFAMTYTPLGDQGENFDIIKRLHHQMQAFQQRMREMQKQQQISKVTRVFIGELTSRFMHTDKHINLPLLQQEIDQALQNYGISIDYNLAVIKAGSDSLHTLPRECNTAQLVQSNYKTELFPNQIFLQPYYLSIYFPQKINYLLDTIKLRLATSFLFILIIIFSFGFTIWTIFRQKKLSDMKTDFINNMTHEFKTPITTISLAGQAMSDPDIAQHPQRLNRFSSIILDESAKLGSQVEKILQLATMDKGELSLKIKSINIHELLEGITESYQLRFEGTPEAYISVEPNALQPVIEGDETHISSLLDNLVDNAVKYCKAYPEVSITTKNIRQGVSITIADKGIGMSREAVKKIFERFYRVPTGNVHNVKGFGLGLAYVKTIVDAHHGKIQVHSEPGEGTEFTIWLPFTQPKS